METSNNVDNTGVDVTVNLINHLASNVEVLTTIFVNPNIMVQPQSSVEALDGNGLAGLAHTIAATSENGPAGPVPSASMARGSPVMILAEKTGKFDGLNFKRWKQNLFFYLTTIGLVWLTDDPPTLQEDETYPKVKMEFLTLKDSDYLYEFSSGLSIQHV